VTRRLAPPAGSARATTQWRPHEVQPLVLGGSSSPSPVGLKWCLWRSDRRPRSDPRHLFRDGIAPETRAGRCYYLQHRSLTEHSDRPPPSSHARSEPGASKSLKALDALTLYDLEALQLILGGGSVIDWHRLNFQSLDQARSFVRIHEFDVDDEFDRDHLEHVKAEAISYLRRNFSFAIPKPVERASIEELLMLASGRGHRQLCACTILKAVHIINHMAGRELLFCLPVSDRDLFHLVEEKVYRVIGGMLSEGFPITEFIGGRKNLDSTYTKLLSKPEATASALYDKLRFRIVTRAKDHILPVLLYLSERLFPFSYVVPQQSSNTLLEFRRYCEEHPSLEALLGDVQGRVSDTPIPRDNRFTAPNYRVIHFVTEVPIRVPPHIMELAPVGPEPHGPIVYMLCEFQLLDADSEALNEEGEASHEAYKSRQRSAVFQRLRIGPGGLHAK
jgi:uncharacterized protein (TIGR04552 family)